jgi:O-antigen/teichoic acid export membrane protein
MISKNIIANMIGRAWGFISVYLFVPLYLKFLGVEAYGLVGFYSTLLGVLAFADMGLTATLNREMARLSTRDDSSDEMRDLLCTYETAYFSISSILALSIWILAPLISEYWLNSDVLQPQEMAGAIRIMGVAIAFQLTSTLFNGGLMGLQKQVLANSLQIAWSVFRGIGTILVLWLFSPTIFAFALWQLVSNALYLGFIRFGLWRTLSSTPAVSTPHFSWLTFRKTWRYAAGMTGMAAISILLAQTDKLVISKMLSLEMLGFYALATMLAAIPLMLASPIALAVFPRLTGLVAIEDGVSLSLLYHRASDLVAVVTIPAGLIIALFARDVIWAWTGSVTVAQQAGQATSLLVVGQLIQAITIIPYYLALAHGNVKLNLQIGVVSIILITPLLIILIVQYGIAGAGLSWLIMNLVTFPIYMYLLHRRLLSGELRQWILRSVVRPLLIALPCVLLGRWLVPPTDSRLLVFCFIGLVYSLSVTVTALGVPELRHVITKNTNRLIGVAHGA